MAEIYYTKSFSGDITKKQEDKSKLSGYRQLGIATAIPTLMVVGPLFGYFAGSFLDDKMGTEPYLLVTMLVLGFVASAIETYKLIKQLQQDMDKK